MVLQALTKSAVFPSAAPIECFFKVGGHDGLQIGTLTMNLLPSGLATEANSTRGNNSASAYVADLGIGNIAVERTFTGVSATEKSILSLFRIIIVAACGFSASSKMTDYLAPVSGLKWRASDARQNANHVDLARTQ